MSLYQFVPARHFHRGRRRPVQLIVLHSMEAPEKGTTAESVAAYFHTLDRLASAHLCIDNNSIVQTVHFDDTAFHCYNANANGIGLEHAGYARQSEAEWLDAYGRAMLELSAEASARLCKHYGIPVQRARFRSSRDPRVVAPGFCGHGDVPLHGDHWDPGPHFPLDYYLSRVAFQLTQVDSSTRT